MKDIVFLSMLLLWLCGLSCPAQDQDKNITNELVVNGDFEIATGSPDDKKTDGFKGWTVTAGGKDGYIEASREDKSDGQNCLVFFQGDKSSSNATWGALAQDIVLEAKSTYELSFSTKTEGKSKPDVYIRYKGLDGSLVYLQKDGSWNPEANFGLSSLYKRELADQFRKASFRFVTPNYSGKYHIVFIAGEQNSKFYLDGVSLQWISGSRKASRAAKPDSLWNDLGSVRGIIIAERAGATAEVAAEELKKYLKKISGIDLPITRDNAQNVPRPAFLLGPSRFTRAMGIAEDSLGPEEFVMRTDTNFFAIVGNDHPAYTADILNGNGNIREAWQAGGTQAGTLFGTYRFLKDICGADWYFPGPLGEVLPSSTNIPIPRVDRRTKPGFSYRKGIFSRLSSIYEIPYPEYNDEFDYYKRYCFKAGVGFAENLEVGHSMLFWGGLFGQEHPEYFAVLNGKRSNDWGWNNTNKFGMNRDFCWANPATVQQQIEQMRLHFKGENTMERVLFKTWASDKTFEIGANDGDMATCECELCRKLNTPHHGKFLRVNAYWSHIAQVAAAANKEYPERLVSGMAYAERIYPPDRVELPDNVMVHLAFAFPYFLPNPKYRADYEALVQEWQQKAKQIGVIWIYTGDLKGYDVERTAYPVVCPHLLAEEIKRWKGKARGFLWQHRDNLMTPEKYVMESLMWDPDLDPDELVQKYCSGLFGPAGNNVKAFYDYLESLWTHEVQSISFAVYDSYPKERFWKQVFTPEQLSKADAFLAQAEEILKADKDKLRRIRLRRLRDGFKLALADSLKANYRSTSGAATAYYTEDETVNCARVDQAPLIDGKLDDDAWKGRESKSFVLTGNGSRPKYPTTWRCCYANGCVYLALECSESQISEIATNPCPPDGKAYNNDCVEIFIDPRADGAGDYYQIVVDAAGQVFDGYQRGKASWSSGVKAKGNVIDGAWVLELAIPFTNLGIADKGADETWRMNAIRNRTAKTGSGQEYSGLFKGRHHNPPGSGIIKFQ